MSAPVAELLLLLGAISETLDGLDIAVCVFDEQDRTLLWNRAFLRLFPEHARELRHGEPYHCNLRRFYQGRLSDEEMPFIERYIEEGIQRHRQQQRPFSFEHAGTKIKVSSLPLSGIGRIRIWRRDSDEAAGEIEPAIPGLSRAGDGFRDDAALFGHLADSILVTGPDERVAWTNEAFQIMYRLHDAETAIGQTFESIYKRAWRGLSSDDKSRFEAGLAVLSDNLRFVGAPFELPLPNRRWTRITHQRSPDGKVFSTHVDITMLKLQQEELRAAERKASTTNALLEATLERMQQGVMMVNSDRIVEVCNKRAIELLGLPESLMNSKPSFEAVLAYQWSTNEFRHTSDSLKDFIKAGGITDQPQCYDRKRPDGRVIEVQSVPIAGGGVLRTYTDITERRRVEERIRHVARHDSLTSLANRDVFLEHLAEAFRTPDAPTSAPFAVHYIDLDRFKPINDCHGHGVGDKVLTIVAERMRCAARGKDVVARMGGDEFAILQYDVGHLDAALGLAARVLASISEPMEVESLRLQVGASIGIARFPGPATDVDSLLRNADAAMYAAKSSPGESIRAHR